MTFNRTSGVVVSAVIFAGCMTIGASGASAGCVKKAAVATAESAKSAKWYVMETMVQSVGWGLWPSFLADGSVPGYTVTGKRFKCKAASGGVSCQGQATFCEK